MGVVLTRVHAAAIRPHAYDNLSIEPPRRPASHRTPILAKPKLSEREVEVLVHWLRSDSKSDVARELFLAVGTINTHLTRIRAKYAAVGRPAGTKAALVARAIQDGLLDLEDL